MNGRKITLDNTSRRLYIEPIESKQPKGIADMTINKIKVRFMGKTEMMFQVIKAGEVVQVLCTEQEAQAWIDAQ